MSRPQAQEPKRSLLPLWAMFAVFAVPVVAAWFLYLNPEYLPAARSNRGELIQPAVPLLGDLGLRTATGAPADPKTLDGKWTLVFLAGKACAADCVHRLADLRQIRLALGERRLSVERLLLLTQAPPGSSVPQLPPGLDGMHVVLTDPTAGARLLGLLGGEAAALNRVYLLDPMGHLMMRYPPNAPAKDTLKDMERLLMASKNWIKGTRYGHE